MLNKLHSIKPSLGEWQPNYRIDRKEEVTLARLRIGHTFITHSFLLKGGAFLARNPLQLNTFFYNLRFYRVNSLKELFDTVEQVRIFSFLRETGLFN